MSPARYFGFKFAVDCGETLCRAHLRLKEPSSEAKGQPVPSIFVLPLLSVDSVCACYEGKHLQEG